MRRSLGRGPGVRLGPHPTGSILIEFSDGRRRSWTAFEDIADRIEVGYSRLCAGMIPLSRGRSDDAVQVSLKFRSEQAAVAPVVRGLVSQLPGLSGASV
jgi:hypothetical protein